MISMVKDLAMIKDIGPLFEKKVIIWGLGINGNALFKEISEMLLNMWQNDLEQVIGAFIHIDDFRLTNQNIGDEKPYRFAYRDYKKEFSVNEDKLRQIYFENEYMMHFYTKQEREGFYLKWLNHAGNSCHV